MSSSGRRSVRTANAEEAARQVGSHRRNEEEPVEEEDSSEDEEGIRDREALRESITRKQPNSTKIHFGAHSEWGLAKVRYCEKGKCDVELSFQLQHPTLAQRQHGKILELFHCRHNRRHRHHHAREYAIDELGHLLPDKSGVARGKQNGNTKRQQQSREQAAVAEMNSGCLGSSNDEVGDGDHDIAMPQDDFEHPKHQHGHRGEVIVLVTGLLSQGISWDQEFVDMFLNEGFTVLRFDNRDHGLSTKFDHMGNPPIWRLLGPRWQWPEGKYDLLDMAKDTVALLDFLNIESAHFVGTSMGSMISQTVAIHFPHKVKTLTSINSTTSNPDLPNAALSVQAQFLQRPKSSAPEHIVDLSVKIATFLAQGVHVDPDYYRSTRERALARSSHAAGGIRQMFAIRTASCREEGLSKLKMPVLVVTGAKDVLCPPSHGYQTASIVPKCRFVFLPDMSHMIAPPNYRRIADEVLEMIHKRRR